MRKVISYIILVVFFLSSPHSFAGGRDIDVISPVYYTTGTSNPAAMYCSELGYDYEVIDTPDGQQGMCRFSEDHQCNAWDFLIGRCGQELSYCALHGYAIMTQTDGRNALSKDYAVCIERDTQAPAGPEEDYHVVGSVTELMGISQSSNGTTHTEEIGVVTENLLARQLFEEIPSSFDWRDYEGQNWITPVKDQGTCNSCWAFASVGAVEAGFNIQRNDPDLDLNLSEQYIVSDCTYGDCVSGGSTIAALNYIHQEGITDESCFPYVAVDTPCNDRCSDWQDRLVTIFETNTFFMPTRETIKEYIVNNGPVSADLFIGSGYFDGEIYKCDDYTVPHSVVLVGYHDTEGYWIAKNSWGSNWNDDGYFKVGYGECHIDNFFSNVVTCQDNDKDGYAVEGWYCGPEDCNDSNDTVNPDADEICNDLLDNDCDGFIDCEDPDCKGLIWYVDNHVTSGNGTDWEDAFNTLQEAINTACEENEIWVKMGTYSLTSPIHLNKNISILGGFEGTEDTRDERDWVNNTTIIDGQDSVRCFYITDNATLNGFTITGGNATAGIPLPDEDGGGVYNTGNNTFITNCSFIGNQAESNGGGVYSTGGTITHCVFSENNAQNGGALHTHQATIINCLFSENRAADGGGISISGGSATITNCTFSGNGTSGCRGGGIGSLDSIVTITNCILWGNTGLGGASQIISDNSLHTVNYCNIDQDVYGGNNVGNIQMDPLFVNSAAGNYHLQNYSPCIDSGTSDSAPQSDIEGFARYDHLEIPDAGGGDSTYYDMGAFEYIYDDDGIPYYEDNCPTVPNHAQTDTDEDVIGDACDNCPNVFNPGQADSDGDSIGDACDDLPNDSDNDGVDDHIDNCPNMANSNQADADADDVGDACDNCPNTPNPDQADTDGDHMGNLCDNCPNDDYNDIDHDGVCGDVDNCPNTANSSQTDTDADDLGDACDNCPTASNPGQADSDEDHIGNLCDDCPNDDDNDMDDDGICGDVDNCPEVANDNQTNSDADEIGDACDNCPTLSNPDQENSDNDTLGDSCDADDDNDGILDDGNGSGTIGDNPCIDNNTIECDDNCQLILNPDQVNSDTDTFGNACDNCPFDKNPSQADMDADDVGDACDNCLFDNNTSQTDADKDGVGDVCDNCLDTYNPDQADADGNDIGDACDAPSSTTTTTMPVSGGGSSGGGGSSHTGSAEPDCIDHSDCDDGLFCNGEEVCIQNQCFDGMDPCAEDETCDEEHDGCVPSAPIPYCLDDTDCDDRLFCNGEEVCINGFCVQGKKPCTEDQICRENLKQCWDNQTIFSSTSLHPNKDEREFGQPIFREKYCPWLRLYCKRDHHFDPIKSIITFQGPSENSQGVEINPKRTPAKGTLFRNTILMPICVERDATPGYWKLTIETEMEDADPPFFENIEASFFIQQP